MLYDNITQPQHYKEILGHESIDIMKDIVKDLPGIEAALVFNILKYVTRYPYKNGAEDIKKFLKYGEWLLAEVDKKSCPKK